MKVLFAVSSESISEQIIRRYQKEYKEILTYKNVYYFNAILKEIQRDKTYDRIVISEDLEPSPSNNYNAIDKAIFEKLDSISDEAQDSEGKETSIILICTDRRTKNSSLLVKLFSIGVYNALIENDRNIEQVCKLIKRPRSKKEAKIYYKIDSEDVTYRSESENEVSEVEIQNILTYFKKISKNPEKFSDGFNNIAAQYTDAQLRIIINCLPIKVKAVLERESVKYREIMKNKLIYSSSEKSSNTKRSLSAEDTGIKINSIENKSTAKINKPIVIPTAIKKSEKKKVIITSKNSENKNVVKVPKKLESKPVENINKEQVEKNNNVIKQSIIKQEAKNIRTEQKEEPAVRKPVVEKKAPIIESTNEVKEIKTEDNENNVEEKKGRGRPRKYPISTEEKPKGKRGRPKKIIQNEEDEENKSSMINGKIKETLEMPIFDDEDDIELPIFEDDDENEELKLPTFEDDEDEELELPIFEDDEDNEEVELTTFEDDEENEGLELPTFEDDEDNEEVELPTFEDDEDNEEVELPTFEDDEDDEEMELPTFEDDDENEEVELPTFDDDDEDEELELPTFEEDDDENEGLELPTFEDDGENEEVELPTFEDDDENEGLELPTFEDDDENEEVELPTFEDDDENEGLELPTFEEDDEDEETILPNMEEDDDNTILNDSYGKEKEVSSNNQNNEIPSIKSNMDYSMSSLNSLMTKDKKIVTFVGTSKNGTSFLVNNLAAIFDIMGINTAILDMTKNKNSFYIYTNNEESLRKTAYKSITNLKNGYAEGIKVGKNLTVYTALPNDGIDYSDAESILSTLVQNHSLILIDCDFTTDPSYFASCQEIYLVQSMDILTIQPLTMFLRDLKTKGVLDSEKVRVVINKELKMRSLTSKMVIAGMSFYNDPAMSFMTDLFNKDLVKACTIPFDENAYSKYLDGIVDCKVSTGYSGAFKAKLSVLSEMVYPRVSKSSYEPNRRKPSFGSNKFSDNMNNTLEQMRKKY
ncbi:MAG: hypothetical protein ACI4UE_03920 [Candidatus Scatovivens sp.]